MCACVCVLVRISSQVLSVPGPSHRSLLSAPAPAPAPAPFSGSRSDRHARRTGYRSLQRQHIRRAGRTGTCLDCRPSQCVQALGIWRFRPGDAGDIHPQAKRLIIRLPSYTQPPTPRPADSLVPSSLRRSVRLRLLETLRPGDRCSLPNRCLSDLLLAHTRDFWDLPLSRHRGLACTFFIFIFAFGWSIPGN